MVDEIVFETIINDCEVKFYPDSKELWIYDFRTGDLTLRKGNNSGNGYHQLVIGGKRFYKHRVIYKMYNIDWDILDRSKNNVIDHINNNRLDNDIKNLRLVTQQQNNFNRKAKGCYFDKKINKWKALISKDRKTTFLGYFDNESDAHEAYLNAKKEIHAI